MDIKLGRNIGMSLFFSVVTSLFQGDHNCKDASNGTFVYDERITRRIQGERGNFDNIIINEAGRHGEVGSERGAC
jgi:hypothetical protein